MLLSAGKPSLAGLAALPRLHRFNVKSSTQENLPQCRMHDGFKQPPAGFGEKKMAAAAERAPCGSFWLAAMILPYHPPPLAQILPPVACSSPLIQDRARVPASFSVVVMVLLACVLLSLPTLNLCLCTSIRLM